MVTLLIFYLHTIAAVAYFSKRWQENDWKEGLLGVGFLAIIFSVGWSISTFILKLFMEEKGWGKWFDRDAASLVLLAILEGVFFYYQLKRKKAKVPVMK